VKRAHEQVAAFNRMVGAPQGDVRKPDATVDMELRLRLIAEEFDELMAALSPAAKPQVTAMDAVNAFMLARAVSPQPKEPDLVEVADALADLEYVTIGSAVTWGIPGHAVWEEVHASNLRKAGGPRHPVTGKALKPPGWTPPDIEGVLKREAGKAERRRPHQRGDQLHRLSHRGEYFGRWLLDEHHGDYRWYAYELNGDGSIGERHLIAANVCPEILEPIEHDPLPERGP
jgi:predicted HAD superfamily Cof-like phosphohydrolase